MPPRFAPSARAAARFRYPPPESEAELRLRAQALAGRTLTELSAALGYSIAGEGVRTKGRVGELIERALGASAGSAAVPDFPRLGIELKTIPLDPRGKPLESTFVCSISVAEADEAEWVSSWAREKLSHVLFVPVIEPPCVGGERRLGAPLFWRPTAEQDGVLRADFDDLMGLIGAGGIERLSARDGRWLQIRPKAAHGRVRTVAYGDEGERIDTVPRGFYLRARFTHALLDDPAKCPSAAARPRASREPGGAA